MSTADKKATAGTEGAKAPSSALTPEQMKFVREIGVTTARTCFEERGNHSEAHLSEAELATWCAGAAGAAVKLVMDQAQRDLEQYRKLHAKAFEDPLKDLQVQIVEIHLPDMEHEIFKRPVIVHIGKDGTISYLNRATMKQPTLVEALMPVYSVETEEQAKSLQVIFGKLQYRDNTREPGKPWYILHLLPDGTLLMNREPPYLQISDLPGITKKMHDWYEGMYGKKPENVRAS
jgi:hypothetical protein